MDTQEILQNFENTSNIWLRELDRFSDEELKIKPADDAWSIGQVYAHLIKTTLYFQFKQIESCISSDEHKDEPKRELTIRIYKAGTLPPIEVKVPLEIQPTPQQPESKDEIRENLGQIISLMPSYAQKIDTASHHGKAEHRALGYLNAIEWYELIDMHFRHHLRQKEKIEKFIGASR